jgi:hypothetical protein
MFRRIRSSAASRLIACVILVSLIIMPSSCYYYRINRSQAPYSPEVKRLHEEGRFIILHIDDNVWHLTDITVDEMQMTGVISELRGHDMYKQATYDKPIRYRKSATNDQSEVLNEVHIYVSGFTRSDLNRVSIQLDAVEKIDVYDRATGATIASWGLASLGTAATVFGVIMIIVALTKSSCPFVYVHDGTDYLFCGEVFSGAVQPGLERDDYFPLPSIMQHNTDYNIKMTNEVMEIQYADVAELLVVDHPADKRVLFDKNSVPYFCTGANPPFAALNGSNEDILHLVSEDDLLNYTGLHTTSGDDETEEVILSFIRPAEAGSAKLVVRARNSFWMEAIIAKIHSYFGGKYNGYMSKQENKDAEALKSYQLDQQMPLSVYLKRDNKWEFTDYFNLAGPMALREDILSLDLAGIGSDTIEVMLRTGFGFWEIDYVGMDFSIQSEPEYMRVPLKSAVDNNNNDVKDFLASRDSRYYVFAETGDEVTLTFSNPEMKDEARSVFLHTRGYYKIIRELSGKADRKTLKTFRKPGSIPAFSKETFRSIYNN